MATTVIEIIDAAAGSSPSITDGSSSYKDASGDYSLTVGSHEGSVSDPVIENASSVTVYYWLEHNSSGSNGSSEYSIASTNSSPVTDSSGAVTSGIDFNTVLDGEYSLYVSTTSGKSKESSTTITLTVTKSSDGSGGN